MGVLVGVSVGVWMGVLVGTIVGLLWNRIYSSQEFWSCNDACLYG